MYGDIIAFEVVKCLEIMGDNIKFPDLIIIPPHIADQMHETDWTGGLVSKQDVNDLASA